MSEEINRLDQVRNPGEPELLSESAELPSEPVRIETEGVFDPSLFDSVGYPLPSGDPFQDDPLKIFASLVGDLKDMAKRPALGILAELPPSEHRVKIFRLDETANLYEIGMIIEALLNDGWCCHHPTVCNDFLIMDFSRRKETEEDERRNSANEAHEIQPGH